jgi:hypothetical protein
MLSITGMLQTTPPTIAAFFSTSRRVVGLFPAPIRLAHASPSHATRASTFDTGGFRRKHPAAVTSLRVRRSSSPPSFRLRA